MKFRILTQVLTIACALTIAAFAKEDNLAEKVLTSEDASPVELENKDTKDSVTESEFSGNSIVDEADAGNVVDSVAENASSGVDENIAVNEANSAADSTDAEPEMSQEEADAQLAADMSEADSAMVDSASKLVLDMTTAFVPSASRRISAPYGIRTYRMHRGVDMGLCHGEDRTIVAAFTGVVVKVRNQGRRKGYGKYVIMDHGNGLTTLYAHLASWQVNVGDTLQAGDTIVTMGYQKLFVGAKVKVES